MSGDVGAAIAGVLAAHHVAVCPDNGRSEVRWFYWTCTCGTKSGLFSTDRFAMEAADAHIAHAIAQAVTRDEGEAVERAAVITALGGLSYSVSDGQCGTRLVVGLGEAIREIGLLAAPKGADDGLRARVEALADDVERGWVHPSVVVDQLRAALTAPPEVTK